MTSLINHLSIRYLLLICSLLFIFYGCQKQIDQSINKEQIVRLAKKGIHGHRKHTKSYSSEVAIKWLNMQIRLLSTTPGLPNHTLSRQFAYSGIVLYESVVPGMPAYQSLQGQLNGLNAMPEYGHGMAYHWAGSANAALAYINKHMLPTTSDENKTSIDSLENALNTEYLGETNSETLDRSIEFGKSVAQKIFTWAESDGYKQADGDYTIPVGPGLWEPTPPAFAKPVTPYWGNLRSIVPGSGDNSQPGVPNEYSEEPSSEFYMMVKEVYDASQNLTPEQSAMALFWRDIPGLTTPGHYASILRQVLENDKSMLDKAAIAYALSGLTEFDAGISCWQSKYLYNLVRPVTYIRNVIGDAMWLPLLTTPAHPEYPSAHAIFTSAFALGMSSVFGENYKFTDHSYDYLGMNSRSFKSFRELGEEAGNSRFYGGIHYQQSIDKGLVQGRKVAENIVNKLRFLKKDGEFDINEQDE